MKDLPPLDTKQSYYQHTAFCYRKCIRTSLCSDPIRNYIRFRCPCQDLSFRSNSVKHTPTCGGTDHSHFDNVIKCHFVGTFAITNHHRGRSLVSTVDMMDYCCKAVYFRPELNPFTTLVKEFYGLNLMKHCVKNGYGKNKNKDMIKLLSLQTDPKLGSLSSTLQSN